MTVDETLRAAIHVVTRVQMDILWLVQEGFMAGEDVQVRLRALTAVQQEIAELRRAAAINPNGFQRFAASGQSPNPPSLN